MYRSAFCPIELDLLLHYFERIKVAISLALKLSGHLNKLIAIRGISLGIVSSSLESVPESSSEFFTALCRSMF